MRALVIGASGFVGRELLAKLGPAEGVGTFHRHAFPEGIRFDGASDDLAVLLARTTGTFSHAFLLHGVVDPEACARDPQGTWQINVDRMRRLADDLLKASITPIFMSTDYVFDGSRGKWREDDPAHPIVQYGIQKHAVEQHLLGSGAAAVVVRLGKVVSGDTSGPSVLGQWVNDLRQRKPLRLATDQFLGPVALRDVTGLLRLIAQRGLAGLWHLAGPERYSRMELFKLLQSEVARFRPDLAVEPRACSLRDLPFLESRPLDTSLDASKLQAASGWEFTLMQPLCAEIARHEFGAGAAGAGG